jgi:Transposase
VKSATSTNTLPEQPPHDVTGGLDWSRDDHAVSVVDARGREIVRHTVEHSAAGLRELIDVLAGAGCGEVAIERPDGPVVDALLAAGLTVVVISPNQVKNLRGRYGSAGNKDDRFDAFVLADTLRTDRTRLRPLTPDHPETVTLRRLGRARKDLIRHRVAAANQLRAHLRIVFPGAVGLFADIDSRTPDIGLRVDLTFPLFCRGFRRVAAGAATTDLRSFGYGFSAAQDGSGESACLAFAARAGAFDRPVGGSAGGSGRRRGLRVRARDVQLRGR